MSQQTALIAGVGITVEQPFAHRELVPFAELLDTVSIAINDRTPVLLRLAVAREHYTVIAGYSRTRFRLFDSNGHAWLNLAVCDTGTAQTAVKHRIAVASILTFAIRRAADPVMTAA